MAEYARSIVRHFDIEPLFGDVEDLVDKKPNRAAVFREHENRLGAFFFDPHLRVEAKERHQRVAVLHNVSPIGVLDVAAIDLLNPADERKRHRFWPI